MKERFIIVIVAVILLLTLPAMSEAGVCARKSNDNPVLNLGPNGNWDDAHIHSPSVLPTLTGFQMWYSGSDGSNTRIGYAAWNGVSDEWNKFSDVGGYVLNIGTAGSWDDVYVISPTVLYANGIYHMWYTGYDGGNWRIGYATSSDGITWKKYNCNGGPVLNLGVGGAWDDAHVHSPTVLFDGAKFHMWYSGHDGARYRIGYATSTDGIVWTKYNTNGGPVLDIGAAGTWDDYHVLEPEVLPTATGFEMWYTGNDGGNERIGYADSPDGINWTKHYLNPVINLGAGGSWDDWHVSYPAVYKDSKGKTYIWYSGSDGYNWRIGYAHGDLWMDFTPQTKTTIIPPTGGVVNYSVQVGNYQASSVNGDFWVNLIHPDNTKTLLHKVGGTANSCDLLNFSYGDPIPPAYAEGVYTLEANIGVYPNNVSKKDTQSFIKGACQ